MPAPGLSKRTHTSERHLPIPCNACDLQEVCRIAATLPQPPSRPRRLRNFHAGNTLFRSGDPAASLLAIRQGTVKLAQLTESGEECVTSLCIPGEVLGLEAYGIGRYVHDATALEPVQVCELPLPALDDCSAHTLELGMQLLRLVSRAAAAQLPLTRGSARERVINFLLELSGRLRAHGLDPSRLTLSMTRLDIASLLDTRIETVSRTLRQLHREGRIHLRGSRVNLLTLGGA